jgi:Domain of unknown function (DUF4342)
MSMRWERIKASGEELLDQLGKLVHEGNVRRVRVKQDGAVVAEFPLTVGVVGVLGAPAVAAVGALAALLTRCTIEVERVEPAPASGPTPGPTAGPTRSSRGRPRSRTRS